MDEGIATVQVSVVIETHSTQLLCFQRATVMLPKSLSVIASHPADDNVTSLMPNSFFLPATRLFRVIDRLRGKHRDMTALQVQAFFYIAAHPGVTQRRLYDALGSNDSVASRTLAILSERGLRNRASGSGTGLGLVQMKENPQDLREKLITLTREGERLMNDIMGDLNSSVKPPAKGG